MCEIMELYAKYLSIFTSFDVSLALLEALDYTNSFKLTLEVITHKPKKVTQMHGEGVQSHPSPQLLAPFIRVT